MLDNEWLAVVEQLNHEKGELKMSQAFKIGDTVLKHIHHLKELNVRQMINDLRDHCVAHIIRKKYTNKMDKVSFPKDVLPNANERIAIYTCILGNYDDLQIPLLSFENVDFFIITDNQNLKNDVDHRATVILIPTEILLMGNIRANRYVKFHPKEFFPEHDNSIYIDGNIRVISDVRPFVSQCKNNIGIAMHLHRERDCIYQEGEVCKLLRRGNLTKLQVQLEQYRKEGFPERYGMHEASVIATDLHNVRGISLLHEWWNAFLQSESNRDQIAWPYVLWKNGVAFCDVGVLGNQIYFNRKLEMVKHK